MRSCTAEGNSAGRCFRYRVPSDNAAEGIYVCFPYEYYEKYSIRRYGFHGTSHRYVSHRVADFLGKKYEDLKIVTRHLGNGSSFAAVKRTASARDTSMGLTPLAGICMGTRTGDIDPAIVPFIMKKEGLSPDEMDNLLNKKSGVQGISEFLQISAIWKGSQRR